MDQRKPTKDEQDFVRVVKIATALGLGLMAAFLYSLKQTHPSIRLKISLGTLVVFLLMAGFYFEPFFGALTRVVETCSTLRDNAFLPSASSLDEGRLAMPFSMHAVVDDGVSAKNAA